MKILLFDIETSPLKGFAWGTYEVNILKIEDPWFMLSFSYKWHGEDRVYCNALPDYRGYKRNKKNDKRLVTDLWDLFEEADMIIGHNGDRFDIRKTNAKFIEHNLVPPSPYKTIDTLKVARKHFKFDSNRLDDLGETLGVGRKEKTGGLDLWFDCMDGDMEAWERMKKYNMQDVLLLERVYEKLRPWISTHPNINNEVEEEKPLCPACGSDKVQKRGFELTNSGWSKYRRYRCVSCGKWSRGRTTRTELAVK